MYWKCALHARTELRLREVLLVRYSHIDYSIFLLDKIFNILHFWRHFKAILFIIFHEHEQMICFWCCVWIIGFGSCIWWASTSACVSALNLSYFSRNKTYASSDWKSWTQELVNGPLPSLELQWTEFLNKCSLVNWILVQFEALKLNSLLILRLLSLNFIEIVILSWK